MTATDGRFKTIVSANTRKRETGPSVPVPPGRRHALVMHDDEDGRTGIYETDLMTQKDIRTVFTLPAGDTTEVSYPITSDDGATLLGITTKADDEIHWIDPAIAELQSHFDKAVPGSRPASSASARIAGRCSCRRRADTPGLLYYYDGAGGFRR